MATLETSGSGNINDVIVLAPPHGEGDDQGFSADEEALIQAEMRRADAVLERRTGIDPFTAEFLGYVPLKEVVFGEPLSPRGNGSRLPRVLGREAIGIYN